MSTETIQRTYATIWDDPDQLTVFLLYLETGSRSFIYPWREENISYVKDALRGRLDSITN